MRKLTVLLFAAAAVLASCKEDAPVVDPTPVIVIDGNVTAVELSSSAQDFDIDLKVNDLDATKFETAITYPGTSRDWLQVKAASRAALKPGKISFHATSWNQITPRVANVTVTASDNKTTVSFRVVQNPPTPAIDVEILDKDYHFTEEGDIELDETLNERGDSIIISQTNEGAGIAFDVSIDDAFSSWVQNNSDPGSPTIKIMITAAQTGDVFDYSSNRKAVVHLITKDGSVRRDITFVQRPRVAGHYVIEKDLYDPIKGGDSIANSRIGQFIAAENIAYRAAMEDIVIENADGVATKLTKEDLRAINSLVPSLKSVDLSKALADTVPVNCFIDNAALAKVVLPEGLTVIEESAFEDCLALTSVNLPSTMTVIEADAFLNAPLSDTKLVVPSSLQKLASRAFYGNKLKGLEFDKPTQEYVSGTADTRLLIDNQAFYAGANLPSASVPNPAGAAIETDLIIPNWVSAIGFQAFSGLSMYSTGNRKIRIGKNVSEIRYGAFAANMKVNAIEFDESAGAANITFTPSTETSTTVGNGFFAGTALTTVTYPMSSRCPQTFVPHVMFAGCPNLTDVTIANSVTEIKTAAFITASVSGTFTLPSTLQTIGISAFSLMTGLPEGFADLSGFTSLTTLGNSAFYNTAALTGAVKLPASLITLGTGVFGGTGISSADISGMPSTYTTVGANTFANCASLATLKISASVTNFAAGAVTGSTNGGNGLTILVPASKDPGDGSDPVTISANFIYARPAGLKFEYY